VRIPGDRNGPVDEGIGLVARIGRALTLVLLVATGLVLFASPAMAAEGEIAGTITGPEGVPIEGVAITVTNDDDFEEATATDDVGIWAVTVPELGKYSVTIDPDTLPAGVGLQDPEKTTLTVTLLSNVKTVSFATGEPDQSGSSTWDRALQLLVDGFMFGLILALAGVGLSLIFGTTGLTNFAHGDLITFGAMAVFTFNNLLGLPFLLSGVLAVLAAGAFGSLQDLALWRPLRKKGVSLIAMLVVSIGFGIVLRYTYLFLYGGGVEQLRSHSGQAGIEIGPVSVTPKSIVGSAVAIVALAAVLAWLRFTKMGKASRAISDNPALASASGINVERVINAVWIAGTALAGLSGVIFAMGIGANWFMGFQILLLVFAGVILGGLGTAMGALVGSVLVGMLIEVSTLVIPTEMKAVGALLIMILILLVRPQGLLGRKERVG
jgi:neutral amino acid transport system permease protein